MMNTTAKVCPVRNDAGNLVVTGTEVKEAWWEHFSKLASDASSRSGSEDAEANDEVILEMKEEMNGINDPFTWKELQSCVRTTKSGRSPGNSGIPAEI